jgi:hypothetical protein
MVRTSRTLFAVGVAVVAWAVLATPAWAQSTIAGTVRDSSGALLPGVTIEVSSPALIEGSRAAVANESGQYRIIDLRPGIYTLTFSLTGFNTVKRELELSANFTATIDTQLSVGALEESVLVSGASPVVDVQSNVKQQVLARDVLDAVPTARTIQSIGQLVLGVTLNVPDVGGSRAMQQTYFATRGNGSAQTIVMVDGLITNGLQGDGGVQAYHNEALVQEAVYQTAGGNAETITGGLNMNLVPKDGGNMFNGGAKFTRSPKSWQGDNLSDRLRAFDIGSVDAIENFYEWNLEQGGPIVRNKVWFFAAYRHARYDKPVANVFVLPEGVAPNLAFVECTRNPGSCEPGISDEKVKHPIGRLTWQVSERHKLSAFMDRAFRFRGHSMGSSTDPETSSVVWNTPIYAAGAVKHTSTLSSSLLLETGFSFNRERYDNLYQPGIKAERGTADWYRNVRKQDTSTGFAWNAATAELLNYPDRYNVQASLSYVTGAHTIKVGFLEAWGKYYRSYEANADLYQRYNNGVPSQVLVLNTPISIEEDMNSNRGIYAQDSWRLDRLTLNYGVRFDHMVQSVVEQSAQIGRFASLPAYEGFSLPTWNTWSPRFAAVYDLFGNGKTAVRGGVNKFVAAMSTGLAQLYSPSALQNTTVLPWNDANGDDIAQGERGCTFGTPGCEINFASLPANFGVRALNRFDPDLKRPYQISMNIGVSHELVPGVSTAFEWYRNDFKDMTERNNVARTADSYTPVDVVSPIDGSVIRVFDVKPAFRTAVENVDSTDRDLKRAYNGFDLSVNARVPGGIRAFGGFNLERTRTNTCTAGTDPNFQAYCDQTTYDIPWRKQFKMTVLYPLPWYGISVSAAWQSLNGYLLGTEAQQFGPFTAGTGFDRPNGIGTFYRVTPTLRYAADCTGPCRPGELVIPNMQSAEIQVPLIPANTEFTPRINQVDFSVSKSFTFGRITMLPKFDVFNALNSDDYTAVETSQFGAAAYQRPSQILQGRIVRFGADFRW